MIAFAALLLTCQGCGVPLFQPRMGPYRRFLEQPTDSGAIRVRFLGTTSMLFSDGKTAIMSDGFITRPNLLTAYLLPIRPDTARIRRLHDAFGAPRLAAVFCGHSHYDHCMDSPTFAKLSGAKLVGSPSTRYIGLGARLDTAQLRTVGHRETVSYGDFRLTFFYSRHGRPRLHPGVIDAPVEPPRRAEAWQSDTTYSVLIRHGERRILVHGSTGFVPGALHGVRADVVYLGIYGLGYKNNRWVDQYWNEVVRDTGARRVILVHWDDFWRGLDHPMRPIAFPLDHFRAGMRHIIRRAAADGVEVRLPVYWEWTDPFAGFPPAR